MTAPKHAMVLAAGLGTRMRAFSGRIPKPLVVVGGKPLIDYVLDRLLAQGVELAVVNVHYLADEIERHLAHRRQPRIVVSDERSELLGTAGGVIKALPVLGDAPFFHVNSDTHLDRRGQAQSRSVGRCLRSRPHGRTAAACTHGVEHRLFRPR